MALSADRQAAARPGPSMKKTAREALRLSQAAADPCNEKVKEELARIQEVVRRLRVRQ